MMKNITIRFLIACTLVISSTAFANKNTVSLGYINGKFNDINNINGMSLQYRYESESALGVFSYISGLKKNINYSEPDKYQANKTNQITKNIKIASLLVGPAYRFNDYFSGYIASGITYSKMYGFIDSYVPLQKTFESVSLTSVSLGYAVGVIINPVDSISVSLGYEGTHYHLKNEKFSFKSFNFNLGYRF